MDGDGWIWMGGGRMGRIKIVRMYECQASELNSKVTSSDSEAAPKSWLDLILRTNGDLGALLSSFCSILFLVSLRSLLILLNLSLSSLISWSFLALTSSMEMYFLLSRQLICMEMRLISFYFSQSLRSRLWRLFQRRSSRWLRSRDSSSFSLFTYIYKDLIFQSRVSNYDYEPNSFLLPSSIFIFLLLFSSYSLSLERVVFFCCKRSSWF